MEFRLFGEVQIRAREQLLDVGAPRQQAVLAVLVVDAGRPVPTETLVDRVWGDDPPAEARNVLYSHLSRIRQLLAHASDASSLTRISRRSTGYILEIDPDVVDLHRFTRLVQRGKDTSNTDAERITALAEALRIWRGPPLAAITGGWAAQIRAAWHRRRLDAAVQWAELELRLGHTAPVLDTVPDLIDEYPLAEPLEALLMRALHAAGRAAEALDRYAVVRHRLADQLGADPGPELRAVHGAILRGERMSVAVSAPTATFAQLPPDTLGLAGRDVELRCLDGMVDEPSTIARIVVLSGTAGVGKTTVAVHWAHTVRDRLQEPRPHLRPPDQEQWTLDISRIPGNILGIRSPSDTFIIHPHRKFSDRCVWLIKNSQVKPGVQFCEPISLGIIELRADVAEHVDPRVHLCSVHQIGCGRGGCACLRDDRDFSNPYSRWSAAPSSLLARLTCRTVMKAPG